jgi:asparagine synthase (glutamine-hydrolysing)
MHLDKAYNFSLDAEALALKDELGLRRWLLRRMCSYMLDGVEGSLFAGLTAGETQGMAAESLRNAVNESAGMELLARVSHLFVAHRLRRETAMSLAMFNSVVETRVPLLDHQVVSALFRMPASMKLGDRLQREFIRRNRPEFLQVINSNTGAPMGAGALSRKLATLRMKLLAKLGVPGYQPYERLGLWLRRELRPLVQNVLLGETCLQRGVFEPDTVRRVVQQHVSGTSNHTYLLMAMMIFELGQQEFIDGEPFDAPACDPAAICYSEN